MEVVFTPACVNVGVAGVLFFLSFVMGFQRPCRVALVDVYKRQGWLEGQPTAVLGGVDAVLPAIADDFAAHRSRNNQLLLAALTQICLLYTSRPGST